MKELTIKEIALGDIEIGERYRPVDPAYVALLAENIKEYNGLRRPIEVREVARVSSGGWRASAGRFQVAGLEGNSHCRSANE